MFAGGRIARKANPGAGGVAHIAEHHGLHVGGGADGIGNLLHAAVVDGLRRVPGTEHRIARQHQLLKRILRKVFAGLFLHQLLVVLDDGLQIFGGQIGIELGLDLVLARIEDVIELRHIDVQRDFAEHLDEAAVAVVGETGIAGLLHQPFGGLVVEAEVQNGVHHAGHGELRARANTQQQRIIDAAQLLAHLLFELGQRFVNLVVHFLGNFVAVLKEQRADLGRDRETGRNGHAGPAHLREAGAFAAQNVFHLAVAVGCAATERVNVFLHMQFVS